jgi:hypothetical protein
MRDVQRMLSKAKNMPQKLREEKEQELKDLEKAQKENLHAEKERKYAKKYHRVKFFERIKVTRKMEKISRIKEDERTEREKEQLKTLERDLEYVLHFPKHRKYVSLFNDDEDDEDAKTHKNRRRERFRKEIKEILKAKAELGDANEGIVDGDDENEKARTNAVKSNDLDGDDFFLNSDDDDEDSDKKKKKKKENGSENSGSSSSSSSSSSTSSDSDSDENVDNNKKNKPEMPVTREPIYIPLPKAKQKATEEKKRPADAPLRTRAEGGRKRRKKK